MTQEHTIEILRRKGFETAAEQHIGEEIRDFLKIPVEQVRITRLLTIRKDLPNKSLNQIASELLSDPITETALTKPVTMTGFDWMIEVSLKPGVTDNLATTAQLTLEDFLGQSFEQSEEVRTSSRYYLKGELEPDEVRRIGKELVANELIENIHIHPLNQSPLVQTLSLDLDDTSLEHLSKARQLALNVAEMKAIRDYFRRHDVRIQRTQLGMPLEPTDVELEALAQTWSEHCKHKIFAAKITYHENRHVEVIDGLFSQFIRRATEELQDQCPWLVSVFKDNAGIIRFSEEYNLAFKVETHNSPSALDPYGGALTGILGVNRDAIGTGIGTRLLANTDVFCFAPPNYDQTLPPRLLHPKRIFQGVRKGVEHGGNKSGVPTVNGCLVFDDRYLGKPLVYCGTAGILPKTIKDKRTEDKHILPGDLIVVAGGATGKDGIHGATFSSEELHEESPLSAVQIGDPFTQKKVHDFLLEARDQLLYRTLTDNGAGGFSSSVGEIAELSGGCELHLDKAPLKYPGLSPWEILVSESQERMTLAVDPNCLEPLQALARKHEVELAVLGTFTDSGRFHVLYREQTVALLELDFLHYGVPQLELEAEWSPPEQQRGHIPNLPWGEALKAILGRPNVCCKESIIRQYDHEVQGSTIIKPLCGAENDGPSDAAVLLPSELIGQSFEGVVLSNGICPKYSDLDTYSMAAMAMDEAVRNLVAVGGDPSHCAVLDNFCWPDPVFDAQKTPDGRYKLAQLVRANKALYETATAFGCPFISGKDSMKNDYRIADQKISVPPTLLISAIGKIPDIRQAVTMDVKEPGHLVYVLGHTAAELGGSEFFSLLETPELGLAPQVDALLNKRLYQQLHLAIKEGLVASCHDCSDGGLAVALAESAFAGAFGMDICLKNLPANPEIHDAELLFSESGGRLVVTLAPDRQARFEALFQGLPYGCIGLTTTDPTLVITGQHQQVLLNETLGDLKAAWQNTLVNTF